MLPAEAFVITGIFVRRSSDEKEIRESKEILLTLVKEGLARARSAPFK